MAGDEQYVAAHTGSARRLQPVAAPGLDELDKLEIIARQILAEYLFFVGRIYRDGANGLLVGERIVSPCGKQQEKSDEFR